LNLRGDLYTSLINKDVAFYDERKTGDLCNCYPILMDIYIVSRLNSDTSVIQEGLSTNVSMFVRSFIFILASFVLLFVLSWELTLAMLATIMPVIIFSVFYGGVMKTL
jgi:ABC-type multidrug transport system fused ATPase/permease subunit